MKYIETKSDNFIGQLNRPETIIKASLTKNKEEAIAECIYHLADIHFQIMKQYYGASGPTQNLFYLTHRDNAVNFFNLDTNKGFKTPEKCCEYIDKIVIKRLKHLTLLLK
jgi:hypothetical protein